MQTFTFYDSNGNFIGSTQDYSARSAYLHLTERNLAQDTKLLGIVYKVGYPVERLQGLGNEYS